jgi:hypothetical protein
MKFIFENSIAIALAFVACNWKLYGEEYKKSINYLNVTTSLTQFPTPTNLYYTDYPTSMGETNYPTPTNSYFTDYPTIQYDDYVFSDDAIEEDLLITVFLNMPGNNTIIQ